MLTTLNRLPRWLCLSRNMRICQGATADRLARMGELHELTALEQWGLLQRSEVSPTQLALHYLERIRNLDAAIGAFVHVDEERALARASELESSPQRTAPLWGLPLADKDLWRRAGVPTEFGSRLMKGFVPKSSEAIVTALDEAGAVSLGKTATPEFGLPSYTESLANGPTRNPWNTTLGVGGSSGGAAAAVAAGMLP